MDYPRIMAIASCFMISFGLESGLRQQAIAQIAPDGTLSTRVTSSDQLNFVIEEGDRAGTHLFHSLEQFSIPTLGSAHFNHSTDVETIITRVTGTDISTIDGTLSTNGTADLFLLNPNGFLFGANAQLDIGGSFLATTADRVLFENGEYFSASDRQAAPLLTLSTPVGLQMGRSPGAITLQGDGHQIIHPNDLFPLRHLSNPLGLQVDTGETLALIGAGITLDGAILSAPGGQVELGSVTDGRVTFSPQHWQFKYETVNRFEDIHLTQNALVDVSSRQAGAVALQGANLLLESGATLLGQQFGTEVGGIISLEATESIHLQGTGPNGTPRTQIRTETIGDGHGSDVQLSAPSIQLTGGSGIVTATFNGANAGNIDIQETGTISVRGSSDQAPNDITSSSAIATISVGSAGNAGTIQVVADALHIRNGGGIGSLAVLGEGNGGNIEITVPKIVVQGISPRLFPSTISATALGQGNAGTIDIQTQSLTLKDAGLIDSSTVAEGDAGNIMIQASDHILVAGFAQTNFNPENRITRSGINSLASPIDNQELALIGLPDVPTGNAGRIDITTPRLTLKDGGQISIAAEGPGDSNAIVINAEHIELLEQSRISANTTIGDGGDIQLRTNTLTVNNSLINTSVQDIGSGGNVDIQARDSVELIGAGTEALLNTIIFPTFNGTFDVADVSQGIWAIANGSGTSGDINVASNQLSLSNGSVLATATLGSEPGGRIRIADTGLIRVEGSVLTSSTFGAGTSGDIDIEATRLQLEVGGEILSTTFSTGAAGNLVVNVDEAIILQGQSQPDGLFPSGLLAGAQNQATGNGGNLIVTTPLLIIRDGAQLSVSAETEPGTSSSQPAISSRQPIQPTSRSLRNTGTPEAIAGTIEATIGHLILEGGNITASSTQGGGGNITLTIVDGIFMTDNSMISTRSGTEMGGGGNGGNITIQAPFIAAFNNSDIVANAFEGDGGNIQITTQGIFGAEFRDRLTPESDISASSEFGVSGTVTIATPDVDPGRDVAVLPTTVLDPDQQVVADCHSRQGSRLAVIGRGGLPSSPNGDVGGDRPWHQVFQDLGAIPPLPNDAYPHQSSEGSNATGAPMAIPPRSLTESPVTSEIVISHTTTRETAEPQRIQEATSMVTSPDGVTELVTSGLLPSAPSLSPTCMADRSH